MSFEKQLQRLVGNQVLKKETKDWEIIAVLKHHGIPGNRAKLYYDKCPLSYLVRKVWHFRYQLETNGKTINNKIGWFQSLIEHDKYPEPEDFHAWVKQKQSNFKKSDFEVLYGSL